MLRRLHPQWSLKVKNDIQILLYVGFISIVEYVEWLAYVVLDPKKNKKVEFASILECLIRPASPKNDFSLPHIDMLVDSTVSHSLLSFIDGFFWV